MGPTAPAPALTRAAARNRTAGANRTPAPGRTPVFVDKSGGRVRVVRALALAGVALVVAYIGLVIASLAGVPSIVSPLLPPRAEQIAVTQPTPPAVTPSPHPSPTADAAPLQEEEDTVPPASLAAAAPATPEPAPSETTAPANGSSETDHGNSAAAPGQAKAPTPPDETVNPVNQTRREYRHAGRPVRTRAHWIVLGALLVALAVALFVHGLTHGPSDVAQDAASTAGSAEQVPRAVTDGGPIIDARADDVRTAEPGSRTIALTFDDGPDPRWTPEILDVLREFGVHATFFVVGNSVIDHPDLVQRMVAKGHEVGIHSLTHADLGTLPSWQRELELRWTQQAVVGASGVSASIFRPPYSSSNENVTDSTWLAIETAAEDGYLTVLSTDDSRDWTRPGVAEIEANAQPDGIAGEVLLMHDGGGDRQQTIAALRSLLPQLEADGYEVTTVSDAVGLEATMQPAPLPDRIAGTALIAGVRLSEFVMALVTGALLVTGVIILLRAVLVISAAARHARSSRQSSNDELVLEPVTVIVPAYNEAVGIEAAVRSIAASTHQVEVIVVDDGSTDGTADIVESLGLERVRVIRRPNGGKPAALNAGLREARHDLIVMVDGDTVLEPDAVRQLVQPMADPRVGAVSGNTKVANRGGILGSWQHIEYVVGFNLDRRLFDVAECMPTVPGAIGGFRRDALERVGGVSDDTLAEDTDLTMALCRDGWRVVYRPDAIAWTEVPASVDALWKQRYRWCYGTLQAMWKHRGAVSQRGAAGKLGRRGLGYLLVLQVLLPLFAPVVDLFALYGLFFLDPVRIMGLWCAFLLVQLLMALYAFALDRESPRPLWSLPLQQIVYRQLMYLVVIQSVFTAFAGTHLRWHRMERYGSLREPAATR